MWSADAIFAGGINILVGLSSLLILVLGYMFKNEKKRIDDHGSALEEHSKELERIKSNAVTEDKVREILNESITAGVTPLYHAMDELKHLVKTNTDLTNRLQLDFARQEGYRQAEKELKAGNVNVNNS